MNISIRRAAGPLLVALVLACLAVAGLQPSLAAEAQATNNFLYVPLISHGVSSIETGYWKGGANQFYVTPDGAKVNKFSIRINVSGCGTYKITRSSMVSISNQKFAFASYYFSGSGTFTSPTTATGTDRVYKLYIAGCGYISGGPWTWNVTWQDGSQPTTAALGAEQNLTYEAAEVVAAEGAQPAAADDAEYTVELLAPAEPAAPAAAPATVSGDALAPQAQPPQDGAGEEQTVEPVQ